MSDVRRDYGPSGCAKPIRNGAALLVLAALLLAKPKKGKK